MTKLTILNDDFHDRSVFEINGKHYAHVSGHEMNTEFWLKLIKKLGITVVIQDVEIVHD